MLLFFWVVTSTMIVAVKKVVIDFGVRVISGQFSASACLSDAPVSRSTSARCPARAQSAEKTIVIPEAAKMAKNAENQGNGR